MVYPDLLVNAWYFHMINCFLELETTEVETPECIVWKTKTEKDEKPAKHQDARKKTKEKMKDKKQKSEQPSEEENIRRKKEYAALINEFLSSSQQTYEFPSTLNSYERCLVHEISDEVGLHHESHGEGKDRHIILRKPVVVKEDEQDKEKLQEEENDGDRREELEVIIENFMKSCKETHAFSPKLNSFERGLVHEICEEYGLVHKSEGEGKKRHIVVQKPTALSQNSSQDSKKVPSEIQKVQSTGLELQQFGETDKTADKQNSVVSDSTVLANCKNIQTGAIPKSNLLKSNDNGTIVQTQLSENINKKVRTRFINGRYEEVSTGKSEINETGSSPDFSKENRLTKHCCSCGKDILEQNFSIHSAQCERKMKAAVDDKSKNVSLSLSLIAL